MSLEITEVKVTDSLNNRARVCQLTLAPPDTENTPVAGVVFPGDTSVVSGGNIRPNNSIIEIVAGFGNVPAHKIFSGAVEFMDDLEDPDQYVFTITLSDAPASQAHRTKITRLTNQSTVNGQAIRSTIAEYSGGQTVEVQITRPASAQTTVHGILRDCCAIAGVPMGRIDLPEHSVWGTYEIIRRNIMEIAEDFCAPFNTFEFQRYYVRCDAVNGLQIILVDYTQGSQVINPYVLQSITRKTRSFERYMPDNRIGTSDIVCTGAEIYGYPSIDSSAGDVQNKDNPGAGPGGNAGDGGGISGDGGPAPGGGGLNEPGAGAPTKTVRRIASHTYTSDNQNTSYNGGGPDSEGKAETETKVSFVCACTVEMQPHYVQVWVDDGSFGGGHWETVVDYYSVPDGFYSGGDDPLSDIMDPSVDIDGIISDLASGVLVDLQILGSYTLSTKTTTYQNDVKYEETETTYTYEETKFPNHVYQNTKESDVVLVHDETLTKIFFDESGAEWEEDWVKRDYTYTSFGVQESATTKHYRREPRGKWVLYDVTVEFQDSPSMTSAEIQYYIDRRNQESAEKKRRWQEAYDEAISFDYGDDAAKDYADRTVYGFSSGDGGGNMVSGGSGSSGPKTYFIPNLPTVNKADQVPIGRYQLVNGVRSSTANTGASYGTNRNSIGRSVPAYGGRTDYVTDDRKRAAFQINAPWMDYNGLTLLHNLALKQKDLEKHNPFWEIVKATAPIDTSPVAGSSVVVAGSAGLADEVEHVITEDEALTTAGLRRLVW